MYETEIARGMEMLDKKRPGWEWEIDLGTLDLGICKNCTVGQLEGDFRTGLDALGVTAVSDYGFSARPLSFSEWVIESKALTAEWKAAILSRREMVPIRVREKVRA